MEKINIKNLQPWEKIQFILNIHWIVFIELIIYFSISIVLTIFILTISEIQKIGLLIFIIFWMIFIIFLYIKWLNKKLDIFIITNQRIIWVKQISFLNRNTSECNLGNVQEVNVHVKWFFWNILGYWIIRIKTAWASSNFEAHFVPKAAKNSKQILNIVDNYRKDKYHMKYSQLKKTPKT